MYFFLFINTNKRTGTIKKVYKIYLQKKIKTTKNKMTTPIFEFMRRNFFDDLDSDYYSEENQETIFKKFKELLKDQKNQISLNDVDLFGHSLLSYCVRLNLRSFDYLLEGVVNGNWNLDLKKRFKINTRSIINEKSAYLIHILLMDYFRQYCFSKELISFLIKYKDLFDFSSIDSHGYNVLWYAKSFEVIKFFLPGKLTFLERKGKTIDEIYKLENPFNLDFNIHFIRYMWQQNLPELGDKIKTHLYSYFYIPDAIRLDILKKHNKITLNSFEESYLGYQKQIKFSHCLFVLTTLIERCLLKSKNTKKNNIISFFEINIKLPIEIRSKICGSYINKSFFTQEEIKEVIFEEYCNFGLF
jgi:hypothetical protein